MIIVFGSINADLIFRLDALPLPGQTLLSHGMRIEPGGKGANQAVAAARDRMGREGAAVAMVGAIGSDGLAETATASLRDAGVDLSRVVTTTATTGCASICTDSQGRNAIVVASGANMLARAAQLDDRAFAGATLVLQMEVPAAEVAAAIARGRAAGARIILNLAPALPLGDAALRTVDLLVVNEDEAATLGGRLGCGPEAAALHAALGVGVVRTLGAEGAEAATEEGALRIAAHAIEALDSTAAGDCFVGVVASALDGGATLERALRRGAAAAAIACTRAGSQGSIPTAAETDSLLEHDGSL